jgi:hypothetical protein
MNRYSFLSLMGLSLAATILARPAQAQWVKGLAYYGNNNSQSAQPGTTITTDPIGTVKINSVASSMNYGTGGTYSGSVGINYVWTGGVLTQPMVMQTTQSLEATGSGNGGGGNSNAGGRQAYGQLQPPQGYDNKSMPTFTYYFSAGISPSTETQTVTMGGSTSAPYPYSVAVSAIVTFGSPVVTQ